MKRRASFDSFNLETHEPPAKKANPLCAETIEDKFWKVAMTHQLHIASHAKFVHSYASRDVLLWGIDNWTDHLRYHHNPPKGCLLVGMEKDSNLLRMDSPDLQKAVDRFLETSEFFVRLRFYDCARTVTGIYFYLAQRLGQSASEQQEHVDKFWIHNAKMTNLCQTWMPWIQAELKKLSLFAQEQEDKFKSPMPVHLVEALNICLYHIFDAFFMGAKQLGQTSLKPSASCETKLPKPKGGLGESDNGRIDPYPKDSFYFQEILNVDNEKLCKEVQQSLVSTKESCGAPLEDQPIAMEETGTKK